MRLRTFASAWFIAGAMALGVASVSMTGCMGGKVASPEMLRKIGARSYPNHSAAELRTAVVTALKLQGYEVVTEQPMVRTSPKLVAVTSAASGNAYSATAQSYGESVAWDVDIQEQGNTALVTAKHRASVNGMAMDQVYESWAVTNYKQLFEAIDSSLPKKPGA
ncbi:MAG TPA: hypothetical protein VIV60_09715 [Polyangiaceae bacterium]